MNEILDQPIAPLQSNECWKGARYFGYGVASFGGVSALTWLMKWAVTKNLEPALDGWILLPVLTLGVFMFFNIAGFMISIDYTFTGKDNREKLAGVVSLLLNLTPISSIIYFASNYA